MPPVFRWLAQAGGIAPDEMLRVFNCGIGMALVVAEADAARAAAILRGEGETVIRLGRIEAGAPGEPASVRFDPGPDWSGRVSRTPTAVLISGRGSNMASLIEAARSPALSG